MHAHDVLRLPPQLVLGVHPALEHAQCGHGRVLCLQQVRRGGGRRGAAGNGADLTPSGHVGPCDGHRGTPEAGALHQPALVTRGGRMPHPLSLPGKGPCPGICGGARAVPPTAG